MSVTPPTKPETALQKERAIFRELRERLLNTALNWLFDLRPARAQRRMRNLGILFFLLGAFLTLLYYPLSTWLIQLQDVFIYLLNPAYAASYVGTDPITKLVTLALQALLDARILQYLPIVIAPFFIAQHLAALYLADIFELEDIAVARHFVSEVALSGSDQTIRISKGEISEEHKASPNFLIGGPGKVIVDFDSAALFERADGTPHVIGPTGKEPGGRATIDGFERFRFALDIRDHHVELRDQDNNSQSVKSRSIDGIPITATDVRLMFSAHRGNIQPSAEYPYSINPEAIERIVYRASSRVTPDQREPSTYQFNWINNMLGLIRGRLGGFMSERKLTEYLASVGAPEAEKARQREQLIAEQVQKLTEPNGPADIKPKAIPNFTPRYEITKMFSEAFRKPAEDNGVELHWIGVGTWKTPSEIEVVSENHLKAWEISQENLKAGSPEAMTRVEADATLQKMHGLIQAVPLGTYSEIVNAKKSYGYSNKKQGSKKQPKASNWSSWTSGTNESVDLDLDLFTEEELKELRDAFKRGPKVVNRVISEKLASLDQGHPETDAEHRDNLRNFLGEYRKLLLEATEILKAKNEPVSTSITEAIKHINFQMGWRHWAGSQQTEEPDAT